MCVRWVANKNVLPFCSQHLPAGMEQRSSRKRLEPNPLRLKCLNRFPIKNASLSQPWRINTSPHKRQVSQWLVRKVEWVAQWCRCAVCPSWWSCHLNLASWPKLSIKPLICGCQATTTVVVTFRFSAGVIRKGWRKARLPAPFAWQSLEL